MACATVGGRPGPPAQAGFAARCLSGPSHARGAVGALLGADRQAHAAHAHALDAGGRAGWPNTEGNSADAGLYRVGRNGSRC